MTISSKIIIGVLTFSIVTPLLSFWIVKNNRFVYHSYTPPVEKKYFVQVFYQTLPIEELNYIVCSRTPIQSESSTGVDLVPRVQEYLYYFLPRGIFYRDKSTKKPKSVIFKHRNLLVQTWRQKRDRQLKFFFLENGKCYVISVPTSIQSQWKDSKKFPQSQLWQHLKSFIDNWI